MNYRLLLLETPQTPTLPHNIPMCYLSVAEKNKTTKNEGLPGVQITTKLSSKKLAHDSLDKLTSLSCMKTKPEFSNLIRTKKFCSISDLNKAICYISDLSKESAWL
jgi:hypothetical protein